eukprot:gene30477-39723_t
MSTSNLVTSFLNKNQEDANYNQYWYSQYTIAKIVEDIKHQMNKDASSCVGFLSTPSLYFSLEESYRERSYVFDYDKKWERDRGFIFYDFNDISTIPDSLHNTFDLVVVDPPFITSEVWQKYAEAAKILLKTGGKVILTTVIENAPLLFDLLEATPTAFMPSIPHLVYQYNLFTNYPSEVFSQKNPEIPD